MECSDTQIASVIILKAAVMIKTGFRHTKSLLCTCMDTSKSANSWVGMARKLVLNSNGSGMGVCIVLDALLFTVKPNSEIQDSLYKEPTAPKIGDTVKALLVKIH